MVEHLYPRELQKTYREIRRILRPGGSLFILTHPNSWCKKYGVWLQKIGMKLLRGQPVFTPGDMEEHHVNEQSPLSLRRQLSQAGFKPRIWTSPDPLIPKFSLAFKLAKLIAWTPLKYFFFQSLFVFAKKEKQFTPEELATIRKHEASKIILSDRPGKY